MKLKVNETFNIKDIMECGQAFRYKCLSEGVYEMIAFGQRLRVTQRGDDLELTCSPEAYRNVWQSYFDLVDDYLLIQKRLIQCEPRLEAYIALKPGIRILRQEAFEMMITFILSQNKAMPQIRQLVNRLSENYGRAKEDAYGTFYAFPQAEDLKDVSEEDFRAMKVGFRAPYLVDGISRVCDGRLDLEGLGNLSTEAARQELLQVKGIGRKVADCILLFAYHRMDVFPLDVWMKRAIQKLYFAEEKVSDQKMLEKAEEKFGDLSGIAQQYIFYGTVEGM